MSKENLDQMIESSESFNQWMRRLALSTRYVQGNYFKKWMEWVRVNGGKFADKTPDQLIDYQKQSDANSRYELLDLAIDYVNGSRERYNTKKSRYANIRSFFKHNRAELPRETINIQNTKTQTIGTLTPEEIKQNILSSNPPYRTAFMCMFQGALDQEGFTYWNTTGYSDLIEQLKGSPDTIKITLPGRKGNKNQQTYYTYIGRDAIDSLRSWLKLRDKLIKRGKIQENSQAIITNQFGEPLTKKGLKGYWFRHLQRNGTISHTHRGRTGKNLHEMRDVYRSLWSKSPANHIVGEYFMGHSIDKLEYDKSFTDEDYYRGEYLKAVPYLNLLSSGAAFGQVEEKELNRVEAQLKARIEQLESEKQDSITAMKAELDSVKQEMRDIIKQLKESQ